MKVLFCTPTLERGGAERQLTYLTAELMRTGHDVRVACGRPAGVHRERLTAAGVPVEDVGGSSYDWRILPGLIRILGGWRPDVVQTCLVQADILGGLAALLTGTPWVLRESTTADAYSSGWKRRLRHGLGRRADVVVAVSRQGSEHWRSVGARRCHVIPNGVPLGEIARTRARAHDDSSAPRRLVLFVGRLDEAKNADTLLAALALLAPDLDVEAVLCGEGTQRGRLERLARELAVGRVVFTGDHPDVWSLMKRADVFVSLSRFEGSPNVVLEAMACGAPLVVSDIEAHREIVDESCALLTPAEDAAAAAAAIRRTLLDGDAARARAQAARARVEQQSVEAMARAYAAVYAEIAASRRAPRAAKRTRSGSVEWRKRMEP